MCFQYLQSESPIKVIAAGGGWLLGVFHINIHVSSRDYGKDGEPKTSCSSAWPHTATYTRPMQNRLNWKNLILALHSLGPHQTATLPTGVSGLTLKYRSR